MIRTAGSVILLLAVTCVYDTIEKRRQEKYMELILQQMPVVVHSLNIGFIQTLKLFFVTLIGAFPLGLIIAFGSMSRFRPLSYFTKVIVWVVRGTPLMIQLLIIYYFPGLVLGNATWGGGENRPILQRQPYPSSLTMHVISPRSTEEVSRVYR